VASTRVVLDPDWQRKVTGLGEPAIESAALIVEAGQKRRIPVSRDGRDALGPYRDVGSDAKTPDGTDYPLILELGSAPHVIQSHGNYPLRDKYGHVFGRRVNHPGTHPYPGCRAALADLTGKRL
jgi:hypothetical protein